MAEIAASNLMFDNKEAKIIASIETNMNAKRQLVSPETLTTELRTNQAYQKLQEERERSQTNQGSKVVATDSAIKAVCDLPDNLAISKRREKVEEAIGKCLNNTFEIVERPSESDRISRMDRATEAYTSRRLPVEERGETPSRKDDPLGKQEDPHSVPESFSYHH